MDSGFSIRIEVKHLLWIALLALVIWSFNGTVLQSGVRAAGIGEEIPQRARQGVVAETAGCHGVDQVRPGPHYLLLKAEGGHGQFPDFPRV